MVGPAYILNQSWTGVRQRAGAAEPRRSAGFRHPSGHVVSVLDNLAIVKVEGYDLAANYRLDLGDWGRLDISNVLAVPRWFEFRRQKSRNNRPG